MGHSVARRAEAREGVGESLRQGFGGRTVLFPVVGVELGQGRQLADILAGMHMVSEGVRTTGAALALGARHGLELPITAQMSTVLDGRVSPLEAVEILMGRRQRAEVDG